MYVLTQTDRSYRNLGTLYSSIIEQNENTYNRNNGIIELL